MKKFVLLFLVLAASVEAQPRKREKIPVVPVDSVPVEVNVMVPQSEIEVKDVDRRPPRMIRTGLLVSTWIPEGIRLPSYLPNTSDFKRASVPYLILENLGTYNAGRFRLDRRVAISYTTLTRSAPPSKNVLGTSTQRLHFVGVPLGLEVHHKNLDFWFFSPFVQSNLIPALALSGKSSIESGTTALGIFYDAKLGLQAEIEALHEREGESRYFLNLAGGVMGGALRSRPSVDTFLEGGVQAVF